MAYSVCHDCHEVFSEDDAWKVTVKTVEDGWPVVETYVRCPYCGSENFDDAVECVQCGALKDKDQLRGGYYCDECIAALSTLQTIRDYIAENIDDYAEFLHEQNTEA